MTKYTKKVPQVPGFYVVRFQCKGETVYALLDWRSIEIGERNEDGLRSFEVSPLMHDLDKPDSFWTMPNFLDIEFGPRITP